MAALVQSVIGGSASASVVTPQTITTSAAGFPAPTVAGNLLICVVYAAQVGTGGTGFQAQGNNINAPVTTGLTWLLGRNNGYNGFAGTDHTHSGAVSIYYARNAPSISGTTTVSCNQASVNQSVTQTIEFDLYEFSGIDNTAPAPSAAFGTNSFNAPTTIPHIQTVTFTDTDSLLLAAYVGNPQGGSEMPAAGIYTLGINASLSRLGQLMYAINVPASTVQTRFGGTLSQQWASAMTGFTELVVPLKPKLMLARNFCGSEVLRSHWC